MKFEGDWDRDWIVDDCDSIGDGSLHWEDDGKSAGRFGHLNKCTVAFNSIHHGVLCVTGLTKFWFYHILKLLLHMVIYIYIYILSKI